MPDIYEYVKGLCQRAKKASSDMAALKTSAKNNLLMDIAKALENNCLKIIAANREDLDNAADNGVPDTMLDRLRLDEKRICGIASSIREVAALADPVGSGERWSRPNGLEIVKMRVPMGVVAVIYEARPNVTADIAALTLKTGNCCVLRGGKEAISTNRVLVDIMRSCLKSASINEDAVTFIDDTSRDSSKALMEMRGLVDILIPRGGKGLIKSVVENARVPVIETGAGNCHLYVDSDCDIDMALKIAINAKTSRPSVCNAIESLLCHKDIAAEFLPRFAEAVKPWSVEIRGDECTRSILGDVLEASDDDFFTEYNDYIISVAVVENIESAIEHINIHGTGHSECIVTKSLDNARLFQNRVDAAAVYVNASTRFTDGGEFGFGAEVGISTQKLHARGPMGLSELTTVKYLVNGDGQVR